MWSVSLCTSCSEANRQAVFYDQQDYQAYLGWLKEGAERYGCAIHAYVLMTNDVHLLLTPGKQDACGRLLQYLGRHYLLYINHRYDRSGTLWRAATRQAWYRKRITCSPVIAISSSTRCAPGWSKAQGDIAGPATIATRWERPIVVSHERYRALVGSEAEPQQAYRGLFRAHVDVDQLKQIQEAWQTGTPLGNDRFKEQVEAMLGRTVGQVRRAARKRSR